MKKDPEATALTREKLIAAFWDFYCQKRIDQISVREITDKAGYHRSTFYEYFSDVYDLLDQLEDSVLAYIKEKASINLVTRLREEDMQEIVEIYESKGIYLSVLLGENGDPYFPNKLKAVLQPAIKEALGLSDADMYTSYFFEFSFFGIFSTISYWYRNNKNPPSKELITIIRSMLMDGVYPTVQKYLHVSKFTRSI